jgi:hypothetical protein
VFSVVLSGALHARLSRRRIRSMHCAAPASQRTEKRQTSHPNSAVCGYLLTSPRSSGALVKSVTTLANVRDLECSKSEALHSLENVGSRRSSHRAVGRTGVVPVPS